MRSRVERWLAYRSADLYTGWTYLADRGWCPCTVFKGRLPFGGWLCRWVTGPLFRFWGTRLLDTD
jgi:hypothetical protein